VKKYFFILALVCFSSDKVMAQISENRLSIALSRDVFSDHLLLILKANANMEVDDQDAPKISEGYLSIAGLHAKGNKLAIEERAYPIQNQEISFSVKGYAAGSYKLHMVASDFNATGTGLTLIDKYLNKKMSIISKSATDYVFMIDPALVESQGDNRFALLLSKLSVISTIPATKDLLLAFPNPFREKIFLNVKNNPALVAEVRIKDLLGRVVWRKQFHDVRQDEVLELECQELIPGLYLLEWSDLKNSRKFKPLKIIKQ
jgi:hypothetical protein